MRSLTTRLRAALARQRVRRQAVVLKHHADVRGRSVHHGGYAAGAGVWGGGDAGGGGGCDGGGGGGGGGGGC